MVIEKGSGAFVSTINGAFASAGSERTPAMSKSWTIIEEKVMRTKNLIHPGEILQEEFLVPLGISQTRLALDLHVPAPRINAIVRGKRSWVYSPNGLHHDRLPMHQDQTRCLVLA